MEGGEEGGGGRVILWGTTAGTTPHRLSPRRRQKYT